MLSLHDPEWSRLSHAYGLASDTPRLLTELAGSTAPHTDYESEPWFSLWSSLCHQGDVFTASYAAVPHIVEIACKTEGVIDFSFFQLPASIEVARLNGKGPAIPEELEEPYQRAISGLTECVSLHRDDPWDEATALSALAALAVAKGHAHVAEAILNLDGDLIAKLRSLDFD
ncbi:hypothetical protein GCM10022276_06190 [Sphingomonas limnosediminicola]|uniref:Uncharacterized protein n=2 Tax=Sphingomonas limnosediminicola TaxID=940133 RepID=A0ABP7KZW8_9SPHN